MSQPCLKIEAALADTVYDVLNGDTVTWTDISSSVKFSNGVNFGRGRTAEATSTSPGSLTFALKESPADGSRPNLKVRTPVRVSWASTSAGPFTVLWTGSVSEVRSGWEGGIRGVAEVVAVDNASVAERVKLEAWPAATALSFGSLLWSYPLDDSSTEDVPRELVGNVPVPLRVRTVGVPPEGSTVSLGGVKAPAEDGTAAQFTDTSSAGGWCFDAVDPERRIPSTGSVDDFTMSAYVYIDAAPNRAMAALSLPYDGSQNFNVDLGVTGDGFAFAGWTHGSGAEFVTGTTGLATGQWHHIALTMEYSGGILFIVRLWVNGVETGTAYSGFNGPFIPGMDGIRVGASWSGTGAFAGRVAHVSLFDALLTSTQLEELAAARNAFDGDSTIGRFNRLQRLAGFSTSTATGGQGTMGAQPVKGKSVAAAMNDCSTVEHAQWWCAADGTLTMASRADRYNRDIGGSRLDPDVIVPASTVDPSTSFALSDKDIVNVMSGSRPGGQPHIARNQTSIDDYGEYRRDVTFPTSSDGEMETYVDWAVALNADPRGEVESLTVNVTAGAASLTVADVLDADIDTIIQVTGMPDNSADGLNPCYFVEGWRDRITPSGWVRQFNVSFGSGDFDTVIGGIPSIAYVILPGIREVHILGQTELGKGRMGL